MAKRGWFKTGKEGVEEAARQDAQSKARAEQRENRRFWLERDASAKIIFLDTPTFFFSEHNIEIAGKYGNCFTCLSDFDECPLCLSGDNPRYMVACTIIDTSTYVGKDDKVYKNQKKLLVALGEARKNLLKQVSKRGDDISYCVYEISRGSGQSEPNTGRDLDFMKKATKRDIAKFMLSHWKKEGREIQKGDLEKFLEPIDYEKAFAPKSPDELRKLVGMGSPIGGVEENIPGDAKEIDGESEPDSLDELL